MSSLPIVIVRKSTVHRALQFVGVLAVFAFYFYAVNVACIVLSCVINDIVATYHSMNNRPVASWGLECVFNK